MADGYDQSCITISPSGVCFQVKYAEKARDNAGTVLAMNCKDGVVLAVEKILVSKLLVEGSERRIFALDRHLNMTFTGLVSDGRYLAGHARQECASYTKQYGQPIPGKILAQRLAMMMNQYTLYHQYRPLGVQLVIASYDKNDPSGTPSFGLNVVEPSGQTNEYFAHACGKGRQICSAELEKLKFQDLTCDDAVYQLAKMIHKSHDEAKDKDFELEMCWIRESSGNKHAVVPRDVIKAAEDKAKAELEEEDDDDE